MDNFGLLPIGIWLQHYGILIAPILYLIIRIEQQMKDLKTSSKNTDERWLDLTKEFTTHRAATKARLRNLQSRRNDENH